MRRPMTRVLTTVMAATAAAVLLVSGSAQASEQPYMHWECHHGVYDNGDAFVRLVNPDNSSEWFRGSFFNPTTVEPTHRIHLSASHDEWFRLTVEVSEPIGEGEWFDYFGQPVTHVRPFVSGQRVTLHLGSVQGTCLEVDGRAA